MLKNMVALQCACDPHTHYECEGMGMHICEYSRHLVKSIKVALCESRHEIPEAVNGSIFPEVIDGF